MFTISLYLPVCVCVCVRVRVRVYKVKLVIFFLSRECMKNILFLKIIIF